jgi:hypothetical protein
MERPRLDFVAIKNGVSIEKVALMLNPKLKRDTDGYRCPCPTGHGGDRAIKITLGYRNKDGSSGAFYCHGCKAHGDLINLCAHIKGIENYEAARTIAEHFGIGTMRNQSPSPPIRQQEPRQAPTAAWMSLIIWSRCTPSTSFWALPRPPWTLSAAGTLRKARW